MSLSKVLEGELARPVLGAMNFGKRTSEAESRAILARALELGVRHVDTANAYGEGISERIVGDALRGVRSDVAIATKCGFGRVNGQPEGLGRRRVLEAARESLERLGTEWIDLYYLHVPDARTPIEETLDAIAELLEKRMIRAWGVSNYASWQILEMIQLAEGRGMARPVVAQQLYNVLIRQLDIEYFAFARKYSIHSMVYNPLAGGLLTGKHARDGSTQKGSRFDRNSLYQGRYFTDVMFDRLEAVERVAGAAGVGLVELAYGWIAGARGVDSVLLGPATVAQLEQGVQACQRALPEELRSALDALHREWLGTSTYYVR